MKTAVITGVPSGVGREIIIQLWKHFNRFDEVRVTTKRMEHLEELDHQVGTPLRKFTLDLIKDGDLGMLERTLEEKMPQVKFLVNTTRFGKIGVADESSLTDEHDMMRLNCEALCAVIWVVPPYMTCNSKIIQFASSAAFLPQSGSAIYAATKFFVFSYSRVLRQELKSGNIYVTAVCPSPAKTEFFDIAETTGKIPLYERLVMVNSRRVMTKAIRNSVVGRDTPIYGSIMKVFDLLCKVFPHRLTLMLMDVINFKVKDCRR